MIGDKSKFVNFEKCDGGLVRFGDNKACIICSRGSISLHGKHNTDDVLYVEGLKHNLLSVSQMVDKGYNLQFKNGKCEILRSSRTNIASRTQNKGNIFHLNVGGKSCFLTQIDESWLWHKRMCHVNFDCMVKISSSREVRDLPKFIKPSNLVCKECQLGKKTRVTYKCKQYNSNGLLDLVHTRTRIVSG